jgi:uncharacterized protein (DUF2252 family)
MRHHLVVVDARGDETHPGPWEWDLKRLATSLVVASRDNRFSDAQAREIALECAVAYREHMRECSRKTPIEVWYEHLDMQDFADAAPDAKARKFREALADQAHHRISDYLFPKITTTSGAKPTLVDQPPLLFHEKDAHAERRARRVLRAYRRTLTDEQRVLFDRYHLEDFAMKVVGVGSVGTRCYILLMTTDDNQPLILQAKEAVRSVLEPYTEKSAYANQGQRVVVGQRLMQSSSDIFLGWAQGPRGYDFYVRQLRDMKLSVPIESLNVTQLKRYARACGWVLARAHAKSGNAAAISGYLGKGDQFDHALAGFSIAYSNQTERDHAALVKAVRSGRVEALIDE